MVFSCAMFSATCMPPTSMMAAPRLLNIEKSSQVVFDDFCLGAVLFLNMGMPNNVFLFSMSAI